MNSPLPEFEVKLIKPPRFPSYQAPCELGNYSLDGDRQFIPGACNLKYLHMPPRHSKVNFDLNLGFEIAKKKDFLKLERLDNLLKWIISNKEVLKPAQRPDFICYRGLLTTVLCTPFEQREGWIICATRFKGAIYLCQFDTEQDLKRHNQRTDRDVLMSFWGYKFEQYLMSEKKGEPPNTTLPVDEKEEYCIVLKSKLENKRLLMGAEVDGTDPAVARPNPSSTNHYVELKTSREIYTDKQDINFCKFKLIKWWAQSFLVGIPRVICGFRNDQGIVHSLASYNTFNMPKIAQGLWDPSVCMHFLERFLDYLQNIVKEDNPKVVYKCEWNPGENICCTRLVDSPDYQILPEWYFTQI